MAAELRYRKDLFKGAAEYYDRFRPPYPPALLDDLRAHVPIGGTGRLLDLACGTGQVAFAMAADVAEVWAVDQEAESIEFGKRKAQRLGVTNIEWIAAAAEEVALEGAFDLVAIGNAFHRLNRDAVVTRLMSHLPERGYVALLWGGTPWRGDRPWQRALDGSNGGETRSAPATACRGDGRRPWTEIRTSRCCGERGSCTRDCSSFRWWSDGPSTRSSDLSTRRRF